MSEQPVSPVEVRRQIWESLVSMIRVYAHAASLNSGEYGVASTGADVWVTRDQRSLHISYSAKSGAARWILETPGPAAQGEFEIDQDGHILFPEGPRELDEAAINWVHQLGLG